MVIKIAPKQYDFNISITIGGTKLSEKKEKIILSDKLQKEMFKFFLETSIPRKKKELQDRACSLSENQKTDRSGKNGEKCKTNNGTNT